MINKYFVGSQGDKCRIVNVPALAMGLDKSDALNLIAWLAVLADVTEAEIASAMREVEAS